MAVIDPRELGIEYPASLEGFFRYDLTPQELLGLELELIDEISDKIQDGPVTVVAVDGTSRYADIARTYEAAAVNVKPSDMRGYEADSTFLLVVSPNYDIEAGQTPVKHIMRVTASHAEIDVWPTGVVSLDDILQNFPVHNLEDVKSRYRSPGGSPGHYVGIDTNLTADSKDALHHAWAGFGYKAVQEYCAANGVSHIFALNNEGTDKSLRYAGVEMEPYFGDSSLSISWPGCDDVYRPTVIEPCSDHNRQLFHDPEYVGSLDIDDRMKDQVAMLAAIPVQIIGVGGLGGKNNF